MKRMLLLAGIIMLIATGAFAWTEAQLHQIEQAAIAENPTIEQQQLLQQYLDWRAQMQAHSVVPNAQPAPGNALDELYDFENDGAPFEPEAAEWEWGEPMFTDDDAHPGPGGAYMSTNCWATGLARVHGATGGDEWLWTTEPFNITDDEAMITYWHWVDYFNWEGYNVWASTDEGATWELLIPDGGYPDPDFSGFPDQQGFNNEGVSSTWDQVTFQIGQYDGEEIMIGFRHWATTVVEYYGVAFDDFEIIGTEPGPIEFNVYGTNTTIPPEGGNVVYDVEFINNTGQTWNNVRYWTEVTLPNSQVFGPLQQITFTVTPFMNVFQVGMTQNIPALAPPGEYLFTARVGYMGGPFEEDTFTFEKTGAAAEGTVGWDGTTLQIAGDAAETVNVPGSYELNAAWPNPFNAATTVSVNLPETAELTLAVYNTLGQQVAQMAKGQFNAGTHEFTLNGSSLSSGIYFITAQVPGQMNEVQKITLMK